MGRFAKSITCCSKNGEQLFDYGSHHDQMAMLANASRFHDCRRNYHLELDKAVGECALGSYASISRCQSGAIGVAMSCNGFHLFNTAARVFCCTRSHRSSRCMMALSWLVWRRFFLGTAADTITSKVDRIAVVVAAGGTWSLPRYYKATSIRFGGFHVCNLPMAGPFDVVQSDFLRYSGSRNDEASGYRFSLTVPGAAFGVYNS